MNKIFIDGSAGTTGLRIRDRLAGRKDLELILLSEEDRKDVEARKQALNQADIAFLCLPDAAAMEAAALVENEHTVVIDTSTAHRTMEGWVYGFPELNGFREKIKSAKRIANPGCHASGFIALVQPLVEAGLLSPDTALTCLSLTGYSGGGKKMIAEYEAQDADPLLKGPRQYGITQQHKHLKEMAKISGLSVTPVFCPVVADFYSGMEVTVPLFAKDVKGTMADILDVYQRVYQKGLVHVAGDRSESGFLSAAALAGSDAMELTVHGNPERILLTARFDNLGKGASGAAIQNMNLVLGLPEETGLVI